MFTLEQIKTAHSKVKSGADFPAYIAELKELGLMEYIYSVENGNAVYYGSNGYFIESGPRYTSLEVKSDCDPDTFKQRLVIHQQGGTSFPEFCVECAMSGVERWKVSVTDMNCTYYGRNGNEILIEQIPA